MAGPILVLGGAGMVGSALRRALAARGQGPVAAPSRAALDLADQAAVDACFARLRPRACLLAAARVGGIHANDTRRYDFIHDNLRIAVNVVEAARRHGCARLVNLGSSCIYPRAAPQPMREEHLLTGPLEPTNEPYAVAKIAALKLVESAHRQHGCDWLSAMPTNLYGPGDTYDLAGGHVLPSLVRRFAEAADAGHAPVVLWGSGAPRREFLHVDDLADACLLLLERPRAAELPGQLINVGSGREVAIRELAALVQEAVGHRGELRWDPSRPDGAPRKLLDCGRLHALGWRPRIALEDGIRATVALYRQGDGRRR